MIISTSLTSAFVISQARPTPAMVKSSGGKIMNIVDDVDLRRVLLPALPASGQHDLQITRAMACATWAKDSIQVNAMLPGWINELTKKARRGVELEERVTARTPASRWGEPKDMAGVALRLPPCSAAWLANGGSHPGDGWQL